MAHLSDILKNLVRRSRSDRVTPAGGDDAPAGDVSTLYLLARAERQPASGYYGSVTHEYEVAVWRSGRLFVAEMRSRLRSARSDYTIARPWIYRASFDALPAARGHAAAVLADPHTYGNIERDAGTHRYWNNVDRGSARIKNVSFYERPAGIDDGSLAQRVARGRALPDGVAAGDVIRQLWGRNEPAARAAVLRFAREAPLTYGHWSHWKWLYKQAEAAGDADLLATMMPRIDAATPAEPGAFSWLEQTPRAATLAYLKRCARRALCLLAARDAASYVDLAGQILLAAGQEPGQGQTALDPMYNWVSFDILYGGSGRYIQAGHGRGRYVARRARPSPRTPDEQVPDAWTPRPDLLERLYAGANLPWQTQEWAYALLARRGHALPTIPEATLPRFLESPSPLLIRTAVEEVIVALRAGTQPTPRVVALAYYRANAARRAWLANQARPADRPTEWDRTFAAALCQCIAGDTMASTLTARRRDAAVLVATRYAGIAPLDTLLDTVPALVATGCPELVALAKGAVAHVPLDSALALLNAGVALDAAPRDVLADMLVAALAGRRLAYYHLHQLIFDQHPWIRQVGWRVATGQPNAARETAWLWDQLLSRHTNPAVLASAVASAGALRLLAPEKLEALVARMRAEPELIRALSAASFAFLARRFPLEATLDFVTLLPDDVWARVRADFLDALRADGRLAAFWRVVASLDAPTALVTRVVDDPMAAASFAEVAAPDFLDKANPLIGPLLYRWMSAHPEPFAPGSRALLTAALHKDPAIRAWALDRAVDAGLTLSFALRLLESGLPETVAAGKAYFDGLPPGDPRELDYALAICDSPDRATQAYGRAYIVARRDTLPHRELTRRLAEHPDPPMQEVVARTLLAEPELARDMAEFDRGVLRARDRGRRAKELVKRRLAATPPTEAALDTAALLELARGRTERDREWALEQLARLALSGAPVDGIVVDGIGGI